MGLISWLGIGRRRAPEAPREPLPQPPSESDILAALARAETMAARGQVPPAVASRVRRIARTIDDTLPRLGNLGPGSSDGYLVVATATDYLPEALDGYLRLPREWADSRPVEGGKTSLLLLIDQLDLLAATTEKIYDAVLRTDAEALIRHGRFLTEKFGHAPASPPPVIRGAGPGSGNPLDLEA